VIESTLAPGACVLVVVDVQNDFCDPKGACALMGQEIGPVQAMLPALANLTTLARASRVPVIFLRVTHSHWFDTDGWRRRGASGRTLDLSRSPIVAEGSWGAEFCGVSPEPEDLVITKHRYSGFDHTELELALQAKHCQTVVLAGTQTNVCVRQTAFDAVAHGFDVAVVRDCVASTDPFLHDAALLDIEERAGIVVPLDQLTVAWKQAVAQELADSHG
jgi:ureidoacrylate peracid hydrolase